MKKLKIGIIGVGRLGYEHACNIANRVPGSELVAIADANFDRAKQVAEELGVTAVYNDPKALCADPNVEAVAIITNTASHVEMIKIAMDAGKHVFCEKPLADTVEKCKEAEQIISDLLQKYPGHPGFMKFKCRFLMEDAGENRVEAERFLDKALKMFPEDGYFLKYKADIFWMDGEMQKAAELYLQVKNKTTNGIVWMEMDRFFRGYKSEILKSCEELIANHNKKEALALMELWSRLIPEDDDIQGALYLAKTVCARTQSEIEKEIGEIRAVIGTQMITPVSVEKNPGKSRKQIKSDRTSEETSADDVNKKVSDPSAETEEVKAPADIQVKVSEEHKMYRKALTRAWKRLGYSDELAELRTQIICTGEESELEWLAEQVRNRQFRREEKACAYKLVGDVRMKQGQTREAFANYKKALEYEMPSYVRTELYRIFINDLNDGSRQAKSFGKKTDITVVLDKWLDKYESIEDIKKIVQTVTVK